MADTGRRMTDAEFRRLRAKIKDVYQEAYEDIYKKNLDFVKRHERKEAQYRQMVAEGRIPQADFDAWMRGQVFMGDQWEAKRKQMQATLLHADQMAMDMINGSRIRVFADNANFIGYELEKHGRVQTSFGLYDAESVKRLLMEEPELLPPRKVGRDESYRWYNKQIQGAITQGIIQGEKLVDIAKRVGMATGEATMNAMLRNARTMHTGAECAGRIEGMHQAQKLGIDVQKKWLATLDNHTRDSHRTLDGQVRNVDKPFDSELGKIMFPGDPTAHPGNVWNCRCTLTYVYPKYPDSIAQRRDNITGEVIEDMTYREWEAMKRKSAEGKTTRSLSAGNAPGSEYEQEPPRFVRELLDYEDRDVVISEYEESIRNEPVENAVVVTKDGITYHATGSLNAVSIEALGDALEGADVTHNHPEGSNNEYSFSNDDINFFLEKKLNTLRGTDGIFTYILTRNADEVDDPPKDWMNELNFRHMRVIMDAKKYGFGYRRWRNDEERSR